MTYRRPQLGTEESTLRREGSETLLKTTLYSGIMVNSFILQGNIGEI